MTEPQSNWSASAPDTDRTGNTNRVDIFDRHLNLVDASTIFTKVMNVTPTISLEQRYPHLDRADILRYLKEGKQEPLRLARDLGNGRLIDVTVFAIGHLVGLIEADRPMETEDRSTLLHQATHDPLTGLPNRRQFSSDLSQALRAISGPADNVALMQLDLDDFKPVNDTLGHPAGDKLLQLAAGRIASCLGHNERAYRLAGDEFAVISIGQGHSGQSRELGERLVSAFKAPFTLDGIAVFVGISIGIALAPRDGSDPEKLMKASDVALYAAKTEGRGRASAFEANMLHVIEQREMLRRSLRMALEKHQFSIDYQPIVGSKGIAGFEALLRWDHPLLGTIPPSVFIPIAENDGLMPEIGSWVLEQACREALEWPEEFTLAVNVSPAEFLTDGLTDRISQTLDEIGLAADRLEVEITEGVLLERTVDNLDTLNTLSVLGIRISLDDFGTMYSSLSYLKNFPFDTIKIDKYFVSDLENNSKSQAIVRSVIVLAHDLEMVVTAEGVETPAQVQWLNSHGCDRIQGYVISPPLQVNAMKSFLATMNQGLGSPPFLSEKAGQDRSGMNIETST
ncbi:EAL domain-containing protein [Rhizobium sp. S163]|uniref:putative bifunctional diguanylate cyclase/phosphodiesterase n=1 Tax=Rhizobium sp. S163 TaxID=3055039 RepID=UPI0025A96A03|nr:EAL domain-containing protein [Rhizobium sp. S163]MDM9646400.1 EAL domain-containing protein [Rhizobium sp. S163]